MDISFTYDKSTQCIITNTGVKCSVDNANTFTFENTKYVIYNYTTTLVKHKQNNLSVIENKYFDIPLCVEEKDGQESVIDIANVTQFQLQLLDKNGKQINVNSKLEDTFTRLKSNTIKRIAENGEAFNIDKNLKNVVDLLLNQIDNCDPQNMIKSLPVVTKLKKFYKPEEINVSTMLSDLTRYIIHHNTFSESIVDNRGLTIFPDIVFLLTLIGLLFNSRPIHVKGIPNLCSMNDLLNHNIIEMAYYIITMKLDKELFINERNKSATKIKKNLYQKYPILTKQRPLDVVIEQLGNNKAFKDDLDAVGINMYPYILLYSQSDKIRIKTVYREYKNSSVLENMGDQINWIHPDAFIEVLMKFSNAHSHDFCRYNTEIFATILSHFIVNTTDKPQIVRTRNKHNRYYDESDDDDEDDINDNTVKTPPKKVKINEITNTSSIEKTPVAEPMEY
ncbi:P51 [Carcinus maenas nudivirus]|uniref:P51 n=1 Tax=Carcinus maenas nudivirus TaxID=2880837 RepID=A0AAE8Y2I7_9VIRU|nr:P51 [Carcinus maenas nudivirus]UBZ25607.1 P51 [Carcinus maenas nudivirus]